MDKRIKKEDQLVLFSFYILPPSSVVGVTAIVMSAIKTFVFKPGVVETSVVEIGVVFSFKVRTIVGIVKTIAIVSVPCGITIISISGELVLICAAIISVLVCRDRCGRITIVVAGCVLIYHWCRRDISWAGGNINSCAGDAETNVSVYIYL
jgi:hypothetical protein